MDHGDLREHLGREVEGLARWVLDRDPGLLSRPAPGRPALTRQGLLGHLVDELAGTRAPVPRTDSPWGVVYQLLVLGRELAQATDADEVRHGLAEVVVHREEIGGGRAGRAVTQLLGGAAGLERCRGDCPLSDGAPGG